MKKEDFFKIGLPKWPGLLVKGEKVTEEQAAEIILRTSGGYISCNDHGFSNSVQCLIYDVQNNEEPDYYDKVNGLIREKLGLEKDSPEAWSKIWEYRDNRNSEIGILETVYLNNDQICSSWIGGPHGWCNWDGTISACNYNIGKWPDVESVYNEWVEIAKAFPFLDLKCQLLNHEQCSPEMTPNPGPVIELRVKNGKVKMSIPSKVLMESVDVDFRGFDNEIGCTLEDVKKALDLCLNREKTFV
jgi:hypothetical protein